MKMNKRRFFILALSLVLVIAVAAGTSIAYFTTYVAAKGSQTIKLGNHTEITEEYDDFIKYLTIADVLCCSQKNIITYYKIRNKIGYKSDKPRQLEHMK